MEYGQADESWRVVIPHALVAWYYQVSFLSANEFRGEPHETRDTEGNDPQVPKLDRIVVFQNRSVICFWFFSSCCNHIWGVSTEGLDAMEKEAKNRHAIRVKHQFYCMIVEKESWWSFTKSLPPRMLLTLSIYPGLTMTICRSRFSRQSRRF